MPLVTSNNLIDQRIKTKLISSDSSDNESSDMNASEVNVSPK